MYWTGSNTTIIHPPLPFFRSGGVSDIKDTYPWIFCNKNETSVSNRGSLFLYVRTRPMSSLSSFFSTVNFCPTGMNRWKLRFYDVSFRASRSRGPLRLVTVSVWPPVLWSSIVVVHKTTCTVSVVEYIRTFWRLQVYSLPPPRLDPFTHGRTTNYP